MLFCYSQATRASQATSEETKSWKSGNHKILPVNCKKVIFLKKKEVSTSAVGVPSTLRTQYNCSMSVSPGNKGELFISSPVVHSCFVV